MALITKFWEAKTKESEKSESQGTSYKGAHGQILNVSAKYIYIQSETFQGLYLSNPKTQDHKL